MSWDSAVIFVGEHKGQEELSIREESKPAWCNYKTDPGKHFLPTRCVNIVLLHTDALLADGIDIEIKGNQAT